MKNRKPYLRGLTGRSSSWLGVCSVAVCFISAGQSMAQNTWTGNNSSDWSNPLNWSNNPAIPAGEALVFNDSPTFQPTNNNIVGLATSGITFANNGVDSTTAFSLGGNAVTLNGNITTTAIADLGTPITDTISLPLTLGAGRKVTTNTNHNLTISGAIGGSFTLAKSGTGELTLAGANTHTITYINSGTLKLGANDVIPTSIFVKRDNTVGHTNGVLDLAGFNDTVTALTMGQSTGEATANSAGQTPSVIDSAGSPGTLSLSGILTYSAGSPTYLNSQATISANLALITGGGYFNIENGSADVDLVISGVLSGSPNIEKAGLGTLQLSNGSNTHSGDFWIRSGRLLLGNNEVLADTRRINMGTKNSTTNATLDLNGFSETVASVYFGESTSALAGLNHSIVNTGASTATLKMKGNLTYEAGSADKLQGQATISANLETTVDFGYHFFTIGDGGADVDLLISGKISGSGSLEKNGLGTLQISNPANNHTGELSIRDGRVLLGNSEVLPDNKSVVVGAYSYSPAIFDLNGYSETIGGIRFGGGTPGYSSLEHSIVNTGEPTAILTLKGNVTYEAGPTTPTDLRTGKATISANLATGNPGTRYINIKDGIADVDLLISGEISGSGILEKEGLGTLQISNPANSHTGGLLIRDGRVILGDSEVLPDANPLSVGASLGTSAVVFDLNGFSETVGTITLGGYAPNAGGLQHSIVNTGAPSAILKMNADLNYYDGSSNPNGQATISATLDLKGATRTFNIYGSSATDTEVVISGNIQNSTGTAGLTKAQSGVLVLSGVNTYNGNTTVNGGTLTLSNAATPENANPNNDTSTVSIATTGGATLNLTYTGTDLVEKLLIGGAQQPDGVYGKEGSASPIIGIPQITGDGTLTVGVTATDPYEDWAGIGVPFDGDANNDGVENGLAWLLGAENPTDNATTKLPTVIQNGGDLQLTFDMLPESERDGAELYLEYSSDLDTWTSELVPDVNDVTDPVIFSISGTSPLDVEATISSDEADTGKLFGRLKAVR